MAYFVASNSNDGTSGTVTAELPDHLDDDVVFVFFSCLSPGTVTDPSGWETLGSLSGSGSATNRIYYRRVVTAPLTNPAITYSVTTRQPGVVSVVVRGADVTSATSALDTNSSGTGNPVFSVSSTGLTLSDSNQLILLFCSGERDGEAPFFAPGACIEEEYISSDTDNSLGFGYTYSQESTSPSYTAYTKEDGSGGGIGIFALAIADDGNGIVKGYIHDDLADLIVLNTGDHGETVSSDVDVTSVSFTPQVASLTNSESSVTQNTVDDNFNGDGNLHRLFPKSLGIGQQANSAENPDLIIRGIELTGTVDLSSSKLSLTSFIPTDNFGTLDDFGRVIGFGDDTNASFFLVDGTDSTVKSSQAVQTYVIDTSTSTYEIETKGAGSLDWTAVKHIMYGYKPRSYSARYAYVGPIYKLNTMVALGGSSTFPCSFLDCFKASAGGALNTIFNQVGQSDSQFYCVQDIQIGNSTDDVYWKSEFQSLQFPSAYDYDNGVVQVQADAGFYTLTILATSGSTVDLSVTTINFGNLNNFTISGSTSTSATYNFNNCNILNADPTLNDVGSAITGLSFISCKEVTKNSCDLSGGCTINSCVDTNAIVLTGATQAALQTELDDLDNCNFGSNTTAIRIEYTGTGDISLSFDAITWTSNTTDIHYNSTNSSALTANMINGANASTSAVSGSATSVTIQNAVTVQVTCKDAGDSSNIQNARVYLEADTGGPLPAGDSVTITRSGSTASVSHTAHGMANNDEVIILGADQNEYNGIFTISNVTTNAYDYTVSGTPTTPATGTITATYLVLNELTNASGVASVSFNFASNQPITGRVRKATTSPLYQTSPISGTITSSGFTSTTFMIGDE